MTGGRLIAIPETGYEPHPLHRQERIWSETNCYVDLWVELLHALGHDPVPTLAVCLGAGFDGRQWRFVKTATEDLFDLYRIDTGEMNVWKDVVAHIEDNARAGILTTVEVDGYWLPDTSGTSYRTGHTKTTIVPNLLDTAAKRLEYFHNGGYYTLADEDFTGLFEGGAFTMAPYMEQIWLGTAPGPVSAAARARLAAKYLDRAPAGNPVAELGEYVLGEAVEWLVANGPEAFHQWSFGTLRQCGATAELAAAFLQAQHEHGPADALIVAAEHFTAVANQMKRLQFQVARVVHGRPAATLAEGFEAAAQQWSAAMTATRSAFAAAQPA